MRTHKLIQFLLLFLLFAFFAAHHAAAEEPLPSLTLPLPASEEQRNYLGLTSTSGDSFTIEEIKADIVLIELFSMYCPYCQEEAPHVNELYDLALQQEKKGVTIRLIGLGAANTQFEVDYFKESFEIAFPLFPDKDLSMYKKLKGEGTPTFIGVVLKKGNTPEIIVKEAGGFESPEGFLALLLQRAGY